MADAGFLTRRWNNRLTVLLGLPTFAWAAVSLATSALPDLTAFLGMVGFAFAY